MSDNVHEGHRSRVRREFLEKCDFAMSSPPHKVLELLLFYAIPRRDTNAVAHELLRRFHTISGVLDAPVEELVKVNGISESGAVLLKLILPVARRYSRSKNADTVTFNSLDEIGSYVYDEFVGLREEQLYIVSLDNLGRLRSVDIVATGDIDSVGVSTRTIIETVLKTSANAVVMAHNHPGGIALPSGADVSVTKMIANVLTHIGVRLLDHIIIAEDDYVSMAQSEKYRDLFALTDGNRDSD